jgi:prepilin signal peptidase PulO-like enzyme (type II secretory pathway)
MDRAPASGGVGDGRCIIGGMVVAAAAGWLLGVLVNLLADSLPWTRRPSMPACHGCGAPRAWWAWSGLLHAVAQRGRCPYCSRRRGTRPPVVEVLAAAGALGLFIVKSDWLSWIAGLLIGFVFLLIMVIDSEHRLVPHVVVLPAALVFGVMQALDPARGVAKTLWGGVAGAGSFFVLYLLGEAFARMLARSRGRPLDEVALGFGDVTLAGLIGLIVGFPAVVLALLLGILTAGLFSLGYLLVMLARRRYSAFTPIPYGPFLILGASLVYYGGRQLFASVLLP